jgi:4-hydroxybenzoate polyprenyltransferase
MRPKQWIKNFFVFAAIIFSKNLFKTEYVLEVLLAFISFCLISSSVYALNDLIDAPKDREHPKKKERPIAAGKIKKGEAVFLILFLLFLSLITAFLINKSFLIVIIVYFLNNIIYSFALKKLVILDVMSIACGFLLRVIGGAISIDVKMSSWILLCTILISLFLGFSKRRNELVILSDDAGKHRKILDEYSIEFIDSMLNVVTACTVMSYCLYTFFAFKNKAMMLTIPFVLYGIFRYQYIVHMKSGGGSPEEAVLSDIPMIVNLILWVSVVIFLLYLGGNKWIYL